jgi:hypothetical protein
MPLAGFEPTIPASEQPQTQDLDRAANGIGILLITVAKGLINLQQFIFILLIGFMFYKLFLSRIISYPSFKEMYLA